MSNSSSQQVPKSHYSGHNPIPTINQFIQNLDKDKADRDRQIDEANKAKAAAERAAKKGQPLPPPPAGATQQGQSGDAVAHKVQHGGVEGTQKTVTDPTTGRTIVIEDVNKDMVQNAINPVFTVPNQNLGKNSTVNLDPNGQSAEQYKHNQDITAPPDPVQEGATSDVPIHGEKTDILFYPTPSVSFEPTFVALEKKAGVLCLGILLAVIILGKMFGGSLKGLIPLGACLGSGIWLWMKEVVRSGREVEWESEKQRGETAVANLIPESVEWMNTLMAVVWGLINPDMFIGVADMLEDVMQASVPGIIENVRVAEINQGSNPFRILSLRALPDSHMGEMKQAIHEENKRTKDPQEAAADEEGGDYYNLECSFAYHAAPSGKRADDKARNMHMQLVFYLGIKGLVGIPLPIFVELQELVGTVRLRLNMTPEPPFLKTMTITLMGVPHVQAGCIPMVKKGFNILNLPLISNFVNYAIAAACSMYVAPKSLTLDMRSMLTGDDIQKDVMALGVLWIRIHKAVGLSKQDKRGSRHGGSDPYITLTFSKYGKPMYCTRVITDDLNPIWEETTALLVTPELIKADENLSVELWDSDRHTADDIVGKVELSMQKMIQHPGKMYPQVSELAGTDEGSSMPGKLHWEVGYFGKPSFRPALRTDGKSHNLESGLQDDPKFQDDKGTAQNDVEDAVMHTPPDPLWPSGIVSIVIHQIVNLEFENIQGTEGTRKGREYEPAKPFGEQTDEEGKHLPTSYCTILLNDELVYRTRAKAVSSQPIFNAGTERFVRDWRSTILTVTVRDSRDREHDPILGVVPLKLSDILDSRSQVTRWYPLDGGIGFGRVRISLLFRSVETRLPPQQLGWDVGTFEFTSERVVALNYAHNAAIKMRTGGSSGRIGRSGSHKLDQGNGHYWDLVTKGHKNDVKLPVKYRYRSPVIFEFHLANHRHADAYALVWLQTFIDNEDTPVDVPIWSVKNPARLYQNYITEEYVRSASPIEGLEDIKEVGRLQFRGRFKAGTDESHEAFISDNNTRETFETWEACLAEGVRQKIVEKEVPEVVQQLHDESLVEARDVLKNADEKEKQKWLTRDGADWSGAFGHDPKAYINTSSGQKKREPGSEQPIHDPYSPSSDEDDDDDSDSDLGITDGTNMSQEARRHGGVGNDTSRDPNHQAAHSRNVDAAPTNGQHGDKDTIDANSTYGDDANKQNKRTEERKHRGLMQWKPMRNLKFAKDEGKIGLRKLKNKVTGGMEGRHPDVETETGT